MLLDGSKFMEGSTTVNFVLPVMTASHRLKLTMRDVGELVYQSDSTPEHESGLYVWTLSGDWERFGSGTLDISKMLSGTLPPQLNSTINGDMSSTVDTKKNALKITLNDHIIPDADLDITGIAKYNYVKVNTKGLVTGGALYSDITKFGVSNVYTIDQIEAKLASLVSTSLKNQDGGYIACVNGQIDPSMLPQYGTGDVISTANGLTLVDRSLNDANTYSRFRVNKKGLVISADNYNTIAEVAPDAVTINDLTALKNLVVYSSSQNKPNGFVSLDTNSKINASYIPNIVLHNTSVVANTNDLVGLTAVVGDIAIVTSTKNTYIRSHVSVPNAISDWVELITPTKSVLSINKKTGNIDKLDYDDINSLSLSARIDTTNAGNISSGTLSPNRLPELAGDVFSSSGSNIVTLSSRNIIDDTYNQVHIDHKGLVVEAFKCTNILDLGITDVYSKLDITNLLKDYESISNRNKPNGYVGLDLTGKIEPTLLPPLRVAAVHSVDNLVDLGLLADAIQGDMVIVKNVSATYILAGTDPANVNDWKELLTPNAGVFSINGRQGPIELLSTDINGLAPSATIDTTNANNITTGTLLPSVLPAFTGDVKTLGNTNRLDLTDKFATNPTDKFDWVKVDRKGRVMDGGKYHTIKEISSDAVSTLDLTNALGSYVHAGYYNVPGKYVRVGDNGKIDGHLLPDLSLTNTFVIDDALDTYDGYVSGNTGADILPVAALKKACQKTSINPTGYDYGDAAPEMGDVIILTNVSRSYIVVDTPLIETNIKEILTPLDGVFSIGTGNDLQKGYINRIKVNNIEFNSSSKFRNVDNSLKSYIGLAPSAVIDATHATNIDTGTLNPSRLPVFTSTNVTADRTGTTIPSKLAASDVDSYSNLYPNVLVLNNVSTLSNIPTTKADPNNPGSTIPETYTKVSFNKKGQIVDASNPTTLDGYSITDAIWVSQIHNTLISRQVGGPNDGKAIDANGNVLSTYQQDMVSSNGTKYTIDKITPTDISKAVTLRKGVAELDANNYIMLDQIPYSVGSHVHWTDILERPLGNVVDYNVGSKTSVKSSPTDVTVPGLPYADIARTIANADGTTLYLRPEVVIGTDYRLTNKRFPEAHDFHTLLDVSNGLTGSSKRTLDRLLDGSMIPDPSNPSVMIPDGEGKASRAEVKDIVTNLIGTYSYTDMNSYNGVLSTVDPKNNYDTLATLYGWIMGKTKEAVVDVFDKNLPVLQNNAQVTNLSNITDAVNTPFDASLTPPFTLFVKHNDGVLDDNHWAMYRVFKLDSNNKISNLDFITKVTDNSLYTALSDQTFTDKYNDLTGWNTQSSKTKLVLNAIEPQNNVTDGEWYRYYISTLAPNKDPVFEIKATAPYFNSTTGVAPPLQIASKKLVPNLNIELVNNTYFPEVQLAGKTIITKNPVPMPAVPAHTDTYGRYVADQPAYTRYEVDWINAVSIGNGLSDVYEFPYVSAPNSLSTANSVMTYVPGATSASDSYIHIKKSTVDDLTLIKYKETIQASTDSAKIFDSSNGSIFKVTANSNTINITYPNGFTLLDGVGRTCTLIVKYTQSNNFINWPSVPNIIWSDGNVPPIPSGANSTDIFNFICDGEYIYGCISGQNYKTAAVPANSLPTGSVTINGALTINSALTATNNIVDANGIAANAITYDWYFKGPQDSAFLLVKSNSDTNTTAIAGSMYVIAKYIDNNDYVENVTSSTVTIV